MTNARTKQTEEYRKACHEIQKDYKNKIEQKYDTLEAESMQFADQAIIDLGDLFHKEKNNILQEITQDLPAKILEDITKDLTTKLERTIVEHTDALKEQRKTIVTQIQKTVKRHTKQMEAQQNHMQTTMQQGRDNIKAALERNH